ncbi:MAG: hypothetical protein CSA62_06315 [Planctomycetota bacterium]|nr:MAG: hypothetical protein CSA62_06315 [Planctomycetota bacterium]
MSEPPRVFGLGPITILLLSVLLSASIYLGRVAWRKARAAPAPSFDPARIELGTLRPEWMGLVEAEAFFADYLRVAGKPFSLLDDASYLSWLSRLRGLPWVAAVHAEKLPPSELKLTLELRRPWLLAAGPGRWLSWVADAGYLLPLPVRSLREHEGLRSLHQQQETGPGVFAVPAAGTVLPKDPPGLLPRLLGVPELLPGEEGRRYCVSASAIARVWHESMRPLIKGTGVELFGIDASNQSWQVSPRLARYRLVLRNREGRALLASWGHAPGGQFSEIPPETKRAVLKELLAQYPGLVQVESCDLRFPKTWRERLRLREGSPRSLAPSPSRPGTLAPFRPKLREERGSRLRQDR